MHDEPKTSYLAAKTLSLTFFLFVIATLLMATNLTLSSARQEKRVFENAIPERIPIKIKIKKEKEASFEALQNEKWLSEFELELTNTGDKPIYFLYITMVTDVKHGGQRLVFPLTYGRAELGDIVTKARPDDVPIKPGETFVLKFGEVPEWERGVRENRWPEATKFRAELQLISFGDGTGYFGTQPYPPAEPQGQRKS
jgi:hypothetical protein